jgi:glutamate-1-semialdehyde 2,1-aminomutase
MGCIVPEKGFLEGLRSLCDTHKILLVFDEVMTGFRLAKGGVQERLGVKADIVTFGKVIGGGLPVGAFAAKNEIMSYLAPEGPVYQAGTLSGNPLAMAAGLAMLEELNNQPQIFDELDKKTAYLHKGLSRVLQKHQINHTINRLGSMLSVHFHENPVFDFQSAAKANNDTFKKYFHGMLKRGIYLPPSAFESYFLNNALSYEDIDFTVSALDDLAPELK